MKLFIGKRGGGGDKKHLIRKVTHCDRLNPGRELLSKHRQLSFSNIQFLPGNTVYQVISILVRNKNYCASFCAACISIGANAAHEMKNVVSAFAAKY
jgi:hypothetical protein